MQQQCEWAVQIMSKWELSPQPSNLKAFSLHFPPATQRTDTNGYKGSAVSKNLLILQNSPGLHRKLHNYKLKGKGCWEIQFVPIKDHQLILIMGGRQALLLLKFWLAPHTVQKWPGHQIDGFLMQSHFTSHGTCSCPCKRNIWPLLPHQTSLTLHI